MRRLVLQMHNLNIHNHLRCKLIRLLLLIFWGLCGFGLHVDGVKAQAEGQPFSSSGLLACEDGMQGSGATYRICMPASWNGKLLVYAHGYVAPTEPVGIPEDQLGVAGSPTVDQLANALGYAFVTSGYRANGLVVQAGIASKYWQSSVEHVIADKHHTRRRCSGVRTS